MNKHEPVASVYLSIALVERQNTAGEIFCQLPQRFDAKNRKPVDPRSGSANDKS